MLRENRKRESGEEGQSSAKRNSGSFSPAQAYGGFGQQNMENTNFQNTGPQVNFFAQPLGGSPFQQPFQQAAFAVTSPQPVPNMFGQAQMFPAAASATPMM
ncbi:hypothetical protein CYMTET_20574 [Cymbomonas tetramitiformis]|uniref:Uncharacterized protein n=1 Tax=Cymbomonas tetramitiformis TaxID=36881 RepID=A0AAE0G549_9CHLO|nr:hypothetical protein CYMTET_20574 [Cymbomonas tetramitiformis]